MVVRVRGEVQLYKPRGEISFILSELDTDALLGKVAAERARLIKALVDEDLFDRNRRIAVPSRSRCGSVWWPARDRGLPRLHGTARSVRHGIRRSVAPTQVQGRVAARWWRRRIRRLQAERLRLSVVVRGGGSKADLATFDAEPVARAIVDSDVPVWTGIGHTGDQSVADEVANRSFITPTECGQELARLVTDLLEVWNGTRIDRGPAGPRTVRRLPTHTRRETTRHGDRCTITTRSSRRSSGAPVIQPARLR